MAARETLAWLALLINLGRRASHWGALIVILAIILVLGFAAPVSFARFIAFWPHW